MNNILLILGIIALSNGDLSLLDNINKSKKIIRKTPKVNNESEKILSEEIVETSQGMKRRIKKIKRKSRREKELFNLKNFNLSDISQSLKFMDLSDNDLDMGMEIITRTKKYMSPDERKLLIRVESVLDLVKGIKKLTAIEEGNLEMESEFFKSMEEEDKKNMMIKEIIEIFPQKRKESINKAIGMKKKIDLFAELFLPDDFGEGGFSLSSLVNIGNLGSSGNLQLLGSLLRGVENDEKEYIKGVEDNFKDMYDDIDDDMDFDCIKDTDFD